MFKSGALQVDSEGAGWVTGEGVLELVKRRKQDVEREVVEACLAAW